MYGINRFVCGLTRALKIVYDIQMYGINRIEGLVYRRNAIVYDIQMYGINRAGGFANICSPAYIVYDI